MSQFDFDLFVIGAGSGGVRAARMAASYGARVAIAEESRVGGTCVIRGCVPKKLLVYAAQFSREFEDAAGFGWQVPLPAFDWPTLIARKDEEIDRLNGLYIANLHNSGVHLMEGRAVLRDAHTLDVGGKAVSADKILIAVGGWPVKPDIPGIEHAITSNEAFHLDELPERVIVVGGGYIAVEFAGIFNGLGSQVTQLYRGEQILRGFDWDVRVMVAEELAKAGIDVHLHSNPARLARTHEGLTVTLEDGAVMQADAVLYAIGRAPNTAGLGLEAVGVARNAKGAIEVDEHARTNIGNIYALGDCTDRINLTPVAIKEGAAFAATVFGDTPTTVDYRDVATAVFCQPPVACVGLTEEQARTQHGAIDVYRSVFRPMKNTMSGHDGRAMMKLVVDRRTDRVLGAHMVGPDAAEIIQGIAIALKCGATKAQFDATVAIHPTGAEEFVLMRDKVTEPHSVEGGAL